MPRFGLSPTWPVCVDGSGGLELKGTDPGFGECPALRMEGLSKTFPGNLRDNARRHLGDADGKDGGRDNCNVVITNRQQL